MKPSMKAFKKKWHEAREEILRQSSDITSPLGAAYAWKRDRHLRNWFDRHCKGKDVSQLDAILSEGQTKGEITEKQAGIIRTVVGFAGPSGDEN